MNAIKNYILAFQRATNYGAVLQIYALKTILERLDLRVEVIDYIPAWMSVSIKNQPTIKSYIKRRIMNFTFKRFLGNLNLTKRKFYNSDALRKYLQDGGFYFVGSDQVWNERIIKKDAAYFLDFAPRNSKKIGYAISMGNNNLSGDFKDKVIPLINKFDSLSVRESFVSEFLKNETLKVHAPIVLDPTLLLTEDDYSNVKNNKKWNTEFIAVYSAMHDDKVCNLAKYLRTKTNLPIVNLGYHFDGADKQEYIFGPGNWLNRIKESRYFITNSFHGTVFAVLYQKSFFTVPNNDPSRQGLNARFVELLESLELSDRLVYSEDDIDNLLDKSVDYEKTYNLLESRRRQSMNFLLKAIGKAK